LFHFYLSAAPLVKKYPPFPPKTPGKWSILNGIETSCADPDYILISATFWTLAIGCLYFPAVADGDLDPDFSIDDPGKKS
jgi:hypothetical protein